MRRQQHGCSPDEQSDIRGQGCRADRIPDFAPLIRATLAIVPNALNRSSRKFSGKSHENYKKTITMAHMFAVAVRDGKDLFLWLRIRRAADGDIYYIIPTGRHEPEWEKWNPHGSLHNDGNFHHKSFDKKIFPTKGQKPNSNFKGTINMVARPIASNEPRAFGVICDPTKFSEVMEIPVTMLSPKTYETYVSIDVTEANGSPSPNTSDGQILIQRVFKESVPWIMVSIISKRQI